MPCYFIEEALQAWKCYKGFCYDWESDKFTLTQNKTPGTGMQKVNGTT